EDVLDAGVAAPCQDRAVVTALRRAPRMHALDHRAILRRHQPCRLRAGDTDRVDGLCGVEPQRRGGTAGRREYTERRARMPALPDMLLSHAKADAWTDLITGDGGGEKVAAAD